MQPNNTEATLINSSSSAFYCRYESGELRDSQNTTSVYLIVAVLTFIPSLPTVLMNAMVILAIKQKRELRRPSNILLSSLAVTDLLIGIIVMPLFITVNFFNIPASLVWIYMHAILGESLHNSIALQDYLISLDDYCLGEIRGNTKVDGLQDSHHK